MEQPSAKRRRARQAPDKFAGGSSGNQREEELYQLAIANSRLEMRLATFRDHPIPDAPVFRPTAEEFADPLAYIDSIRAEAEPHGICKIVPPEGWKVPCAVDWTSPKRFNTKKQRVDNLGEALPFDDGNRYTLAESFFCRAGSSSDGDRGDDSAEFRPRPRSGPKTTSPNAAATDVDNPVATSVTRRLRRGQFRGDESVARP